MTLPPQPDQTWVDAQMQARGDIDVNAAINQLPSGSVRAAPTVSPPDPTPVEVRYLSPIGVTEPPKPVLRAAATPGSSVASSSVGSVRSNAQSAGSHRSVAGASVPKPAVPIYIAPQPVMYAPVVPRQTAAVVVTTDRPRQEDVPKEVRLSPMHLDPSVEYEKLVEIQNAIRLLLYKHPRLKMPQPEELNIATLHGLEKYHNKIVRNIQIGKFQRKGLRWWIFGILVIQTWLTRLIGINVTGFIEDQLDEIEDVSDDLYELGDEWLPVKGGERVPASQRIASNIAYSLVLVAGINFLVSVAKIYNIHLPEKAVYTGRDVLKRVIRDDDNFLAPLEGDDTMKSFLGIAQTLSNLDYEKLAANPQLKAVLPFLSNLTGIFQQPQGGQPPQTQPQPGFYGQQNTYPPTTNSGSTPDRYML